MLRIATNRKAAWQANVNGRRVVKEKQKAGAGGAAPPPKVVPLEGYECLIKCCAPIPPDFSLVQEN